jgi:hypothetical protein
LRQHHARIAFLALLADLLDGGDGAASVGRLKTLLLGPKLPMAACVAYPWDVQYLLDHLAPRLPDGQNAYLTALLAAINAPEQAAALGCRSEVEVFSPPPLHPHG